MDRMPVHPSVPGFALKSFPRFLYDDREERAQKNHGQSLETLARRGGLTHIEMLALACDLPLQRLTGLEERTAHQILQRMMRLVSDALGDTVR